MTVNYFKHLCVDYLFCGISADDKSPYIFDKIVKEKAIIFEHQRFWANTDGYSTLDYDNNYKSWRITIAIFSSKDYAGLEVLINTRQNTVIYHIVKEDIAGYTITAGISPDLFI
jgi:hypothetical protein